MGKEEVKAIWPGVFENLSGVEANLRIFCGDCDLTYNDVVIVHAVPHMIYFVCSDGQNKVICGEYIITIKGE